MMRTFFGTFLILVSLALMAVGLFVPSNYRGIDARLLTVAGKGTPSLVEEGLELVKAGRIGSAGMFSQAAKALGGEGLGRLELSLEKVTDPGLIAWGRHEAGLSRLLGSELAAGSVESKPILKWLIPRDNRLVLLRYLRESSRFGVIQVLQTRGLTNLVHFAPLDSSSGHPLDAVTLLTGLLLEGDHVGKPLKEAFEAMGREAVKAGKVQELELVYLDLVALGSRLSWGQLTDLLERCESIDHLRQLAFFSRNRVDDFPSVFAAIIFSNSTGLTLDYLAEFGKTGMSDMEYSLRAGRGAVVRLLQIGEQVNYRPVRDRLAALTPMAQVLGPMFQAAEGSLLMGVVMKYGLILVGGLILIGVGWLVAPVVGVRTPQGFLSINQLVFLSGLVLLLFVLSEPFIFGDPQTLEFPLHWKLPMLGDVVTSTIANKPKPMNSLSWLALVLFLVLQAVIYVICLVKLAEILRQPISSKLKLKLLENEENMFDAGLYVGLGGTVGSLVFLAMNIVDASLMAAYTSTLFGIIFVAILKIFHIRPRRRALIMDGEQ